MIVGYSPNVKIKEQTPYTCICWVVSQCDCWVLSMQGFRMESCTPPICVNRICFLTFYVYIAIYLFYIYTHQIWNIYAYIYIHVYILYIYILKNLQPAHALRYSHSAGGWGNLEASPPSGIEGLVITRRMLKSILVSMHVPRWQPTRNSRQSKGIPKRMAPQATVERSI